MINVIYYLLKLHLRTLIALPKIMALDILHTIRLKVFRLEVKKPLKLFLIILYIKVMNLQKKIFIKFLISFHSKNYMKLFWIISTKFPYIGYFSQSLILRNIGKMDQMNKNMNSLSQFFNL